MEEQEKQEKLDLGLVKQTLKLFAGFYKKGGLYAKLWRIQAGGFIV